jgi:hypothetical protein
MSDLHARLLAAVAEQKRIAEEGSADDGWTRELVRDTHIAGQYTLWDVSPVDPTTRDPIGALHTDRRTADFYNAWSPAVALRWLAMAEKVLERHTADSAGSHRFCLPGCREGDCICGTSWPCDEIRDLADALGVPIEEEQK